MFSIHTSIFNICKMRFDWKEAFENWLSFLNGTGQLVVAINTSEDDTSAKVKEFFQNWKRTNPQNRTKIEVLDIEIPYTDPAFDGKGKAAALAACTEPYCILLDIDERIVPSMRDKWVRVARDLEYSAHTQALLIPSIDLIGDEKHYKSAGQLGCKWYLHKNSPNLTRGVVDFARRADGTFDKTKSDSCELVVRDTFKLASSAPIVANSLPQWMVMSQIESGEIPFVYHLGWMDAEQRVRQAEFWRPVWNLRDPTKEEPPTTLVDLEKIPRYRHNLPSWKEQS